MKLNAIHKNLFGLLIAISSFHPAAQAKPTIRNPGACRIQPAVFKQIQKNGEDEGITLNGLYFELEMKYVDENYRSLRDVNGRNVAKLFGDRDMSMETYNGDRGPLAAIKVIGQIPQTIGRALMPNRVGSAYVSNVHEAGTHIFLSSTFSDKSQLLFQLKLFPSANISKQRLDAVLAELAVCH